MVKDTAYLFASAIDNWTVLTGGFDFDRYFPNEEVCRAYLYRHRWPNGFFCPRCGDVCSYQMHTRDLIECANRKCRYQTSLTSGTIFHRSKLPLRTWFKALQLYTRHNVDSPTLLSELIKVSYKTAWLMLKKMHEAYKYYDREMLRDLSHPLAVVINDPFMEEKSRFTEEKLMAYECTDEPEEEGVLPAEPEAAAAFAAAGLLLEKRITRQEWKIRQRIRKTLFSIPKFHLVRYFLLHFVCCVNSPPLYRMAS